VNILILGSGGREHAFCWKISKSEFCSKLFIAPGNAGTAQFGENLPVSESDFAGVRNICIDKKIDLVVVGPESPLVNGIYDFFKDDAQLCDIIITGPSRAGAQLEGSKAFAKAFMQRHHIPTAAYQEFDKSSYEAGYSYIKNHSLPVVLKADGLAAGKGVIICNNHTEALAEYEMMIQQSKFGDAGRKVVVEEFLDGIELSVFVLTDGEAHVLLPGAKDYKKIGVGDTGLNTGGMGAVSPVPFATADFMEKVTEKIISPTIDGLKKEKIDYKGFVFFGLIKVKDEPIVIEYNCRMGDPETEVVLMRLKSDLVSLLIATATGKLHEQKTEIDTQAAATIVAVSEGYPMDYNKGVKIEFDHGQELRDKTVDDPGGRLMVFHAATRREGDNIVTNGGRVLAVSAMAATLAEAVALSKERLQKIHFNGMYYRNDIGYEFVG
jgi:phosphoribosylamine---glycine ligase